MSDADVSPAYVARYLGVTSAAVSNWVRRESLPPELRPRMIKGPVRNRPAWRESQLPGLREWLSGHYPRASRTFLTEVTAAGLLPGDLIVTCPGEDGSITIRRARPAEGNQS